MPDWLSEALVVGAACVVGLAAAAVTLLMMVIMTAPYWAIGLLALWFVGII